MFDVQDKPSSFTVLSGSWIAYGGKNFTGPCIYHFEGTKSKIKIYILSTVLYCTIPNISFPFLDENISNDPAIETEDQLKTWQECLIFFFQKNNYLFYPFPPKCLKII